MLESNESFSNLFGIRDHLTILFRYKRLILIILFFSLLITGPGSFTLSEVFQAKSRILIQQNRETLKIGASQNPTNTYASQQNIIKTQIEIFNSPVLIDRLVKQLDAKKILSKMKWRWDWLRALPSTSVDFVKSIFVDIDKSSPEWAAAQSIVNNLNVSPILKTSIFEVTFNSPDPKFSALVLNTLVEFYLDHYSSLLHGKSANVFFGQEVERLKKQVDVAQFNLIVFKKKHGIVNLQMQKQILLQNINNARSNINSTIVKRARAKRRIKYLKKQLSGGAVYTLGTLRYAEIQKDLSKEKRNYEALLSNKNYRNEIQAGREKLFKLSSLEEKFSNLERSGKLKKETLKLYLKKKEESLINVTLDHKKITNVTQIELAKVPVEPISPKKKKNMLFGMVGGLLGGISLAYLLNFFRRTFSTCNEVEGFLGRPVFASFPLADSSTGFAGGVLEISVLRERINKLREGKNCNSLLFASTIGGEGKTYVASHLATKLAESGTKTLLFSDHSHLLGKKNSLGNGKLRVRSIPNKRVLVRYIEKYSSKNFYIIVDGPAINDDADLIYLAPRVAAVLVIIEADCITQMAVSKSLKAFEDAGGRVIGFILNKCENVLPDWVDEKFFSLKSKNSKQVSV